MELGLTSLMLYAKIPQLFAKAVSYQLNNTQEEKRKVPAYEVL